MTRDEEKALLETIAKLRAEIEALKHPPPRAPQRFDRPYDHNIRFGMPQSAVDAMVAAVPDRLVRDLVSDGRKPVSLPGPGPGPEPIHSDRGWVNPAPLKSPPF
jgi:hypothetical protein